MLYVEGCRFTRMGLGLRNERSTASVFYPLAPSKCCERLQPARPSIEPRTLSPSPLESCRFSHERSVQALPVPRNQRLDPLARHSAAILADVLQSPELSSNPMEGP